MLTNLVTYNNFLPQGAPTSSYISNLILRSFDIKIGTYCEEEKIAYTRYCDDMTFSGDFDVEEVINLVKKELLKENFILNKKKIKIIRPNKAQIVTGIVCNEKLSVPKSYKKEIRQIMYYLNKYGLSNHLKHIGYQYDKRIYINKLFGRILFILQVEKDNQEFINYKMQLIKLKEN